VNTNFRWAFGALTVSMFGSEISTLALPLVAAISLGAGPIEMGLLAGAARLPTFLVSLAAGVIVDRLTRKRRLMIAMDLVRAGLLLAVPAALLTGYLSMPLLYGVTFLIGAGSVFHELAQNAYIPSLVSSAQLLDANSKLQVSYSVGESVGPGAGGLLVQLVTAPFAVIADAVSYIVSAGMLGRARTTEPPVSRHKAREPLREVREGVRALLRDRWLGPWAVWGAVAVVFMGAFEAQYLLFAVRGLHLSPLLIGLIAIAGAAGAIPAAFLTTRIARRLPTGKSIILALMAYFVFTLAVPAAAGPVTVIFITLAVAKIAQTFAFTVSNVQQWSLRQLVTPPELLGRVSAANRFLIGTAETIGAVASGPLADTLGLRATLATAGIGGALVLAPLIGRPIWRLQRMPQGRR
jgi:MFS family permease